MRVHAPARGACCAAALWIASACAAACPSDAAPRAADTVLVVQGAGPAPWSLSSADLSALPASRLTQRQTVSSATGVASERSVAWSGVLVRDLLAKAGFGGPNDRGARTAIVEAVATDGYRAVYSWGELFNSALGDQVLVITAQDERPLDAAAGPLALRSLADLRPGPRHVRNLCALVVRR